jgi:hypothetical protein
MRRPPGHKVLERSAADRLAAAGDAAMTQLTLLFVFAVERVTGHPT